MAKVGGYRAGIEQLAEGLKNRGSAAVVDKAPAKMQKPDTTVTVEARPQADVEVRENADYVVDVSSLKDRAQRLIDSGQFSGDDLSFLQKVAVDPEN